MKYIDLLKRDEEKIKQDEAESRAELAKNSAERDIINIKHEIVKLKNKLEEMKSDEDFNLRSIVETSQEIEILKKDLAKAEEIVKELF